MRFSLHSVVSISIHLQLPVTVCFGTHTHRFLPFPFAVSVSLPTRRPTPNPNPNPNPIHYMYSAELFGVFAVHGGDASLPFSAAATATNTRSCFKNAAAHNVLNTVRFPKASTLCRCNVDSKSVAGGDVFSVTPSSKSDVDYLGQSTKGDLNVKLEHLEALGIKKISPFYLFFFKFFFRNSTFFLTLFEH